MSSENRPARTVSELKPAADALFNDIKKIIGGSYGTHVRLVDPIYRAWENAKKDNGVESELKNSLESTNAFADKFAPSSTKTEQGSAVRGLGEYVGTFILNKLNSSGIRTKDQETPQNNDWLEIPIKNGKRIYVKKDVYISVLEELRKNSFTSGIPNNIDGHDLGFHATTSATLEGIGKYEALLSSKKIIELNEELKNGERLGSFFGETQNTNEEISAYVGRVKSVYGTPRWFDEFCILFAISLDKQGDYLKKQGKRVRYLSAYNEVELGDTIPLKNIQYVATDYVNLNKVKKWLDQSYLTTPVYSMEYMYLMDKIK